MGETLGSPTVSMTLQNLAQQAQRYPAMVFNNVLHLIDQDFLLEAYRLTRKNSAPGVDQVTATPYAERLANNLRDLHERLRDNRYVAPPVTTTASHLGRRCAARGLACHPRAGARRGPRVSGSPRAMQGS